MAQTSNYNLYKYELSSPADLTKINGNMDIIDAELKEHQDGIDNHEGRIDTAETTITDHEGRIDVIEAELAGVIAPVVVGSFITQAGRGGGGVNLGFRPKVVQLLDWQSNVGNIKATATTTLPDNTYLTITATGFTAKTGVSGTAGSTTTVHYIVYR